MTTLKTSYNFIAIGATLAMLSVLLGAFGAHGLKPHLTSYGIAIYQTAADYHIYHALGLIGLGLYEAHYQTSGWLNLAGFSFIVGILLFCGSLYALAVFKLQWLVFLTPFGGLSFVIGWTCFTIQAIKSKHNTP